MSLARLKYVTNQLLQISYKSYLIYIYIYMCVCVCVCVCVSVYKAVTCMSGSSNLDSFRDGRQVAV